MTIEPGNIAAVESESLEFERSAILRQVIQRMMVLRTESARSSILHRVPAEHFPKLCMRLLNPNIELQDTLLWLCDIVKQPPTLSSLQRLYDRIHREFLDILREKYLPVHFDFRAQRGKE